MKTEKPFKVGEQERGPMIFTRRVVIKVEGGIASIAEAPPDVEVEIIDYDTDGLADDALCHCHLAGADAAHIHR